MGDRLYNKLHPNNWSIKENTGTSTKEGITHIIGGANSNNLIIGLSSGSINFLDPERSDKIIARWTVDGSRLTGLTDLGQSSSGFHQHCFFAVTENSWLGLVDLRSKALALKARSSPLKGIPSAVCHSLSQDQVLIGTQRGFIDVLDLRKRLYLENFYLQRGGESLPIDGIQPFIPTSKFANDLGKIDEDQYLIHYPSNFQEFSVFNLPPLQKSGQESRTPLLHFQAENARISNSTLRQTEVPHVTRQKPANLVDINYRLNAEGLMLSRRLLDSQGILARDPSLYTDTLKVNLDFLLSQNKLHLMANQFQGAGVFERRSEFFNSVASLATAPLRPQEGQSVSFDNMIFSAGEDRNIRFLNFGNELKIRAPMSEDYKGQKSYLLSNSDFKKRAFFYHYSGDVCLLRESFLKPKADLPEFGDLNGISHAFGFSTFHDHVAESGLSEAHIYNIEKQNKLGSLGESSALPGHTKRINALLLLMHKNNPHLVSASDDHSIKIWK